MCEITVQLRLTGTIRWMIIFCYYQWKIPKFSQLRNNNGIISTIRSKNGLLWLRRVQFVRNKTRLIFWRVISNELINRMVKSKVKWWLRPPVANNKLHKFHMNFCRWRITKAGIFITDKLLMLFWTKSFTAVRCWHELQLKNCSQYCRRRKIHFLVISKNIA